MTQRFNMDDDDRRELVVLAVYMVLGSLTLFLLMLRLNGFAISWAMCLAPLWAPVLLVLAGLVAIWIGRRL